MNRQTIVFGVKMITLGIFLTILFNWSFNLYESFISELPNFEKAIIDDYLPGISEDYTYVIYEDKILDLENNPVIVDSKIYLPIDFVISTLNPDFFWDLEEETLTYTTKNEVIRMKTDELTYYVNNEPLILNLPITYFDSQVPYMPVDTLLMFSEYRFTYNETIDLLMIDDPTLNQVFVNPNKEHVYLKTYSREDSRYIMMLYPTHQLKVYGEAEGYYFVRTTEGYFGYLAIEDAGPKLIEHGLVSQPITTDYKESKNFSGKINLVWHQVTVASANANVYEALEGVYGLDVISPTWFELSNEEGDVRNIASKEYVDYVHGLGIEVWALFSNAFDKNLTHEVLSSTMKREKVIKQILAYAALYNLDGINIDFENVGVDTGIYFVQFVKEITPYLQNQGLVVSVDMYVPRPWTEHYGREAIGEIIDYLIIMGYDEHWSTSPISGSVASIGFVEEGVVDTMAMVPKERIILGVPYYTRRWNETLVDGEVKVTSNAYSMNYAYELLVSNGADIIWDDVVGQYYGEYTIDGVRHRIWLEEERSMALKVDLVETYNLAGVAGWKLGLEKDEIWDVLYSKLKE